MTTIQKRNGKGVALVAAFLVLAVIFALTLALLQTTISQTGLTENTRDREQALMLAEAGVSAAINELNLNKALNGSQTIGSPSATWGEQQQYSAVSTLNSDGTYTIQSVGTIPNVVNAGAATSTQRKIIAVVSTAASGGRFTYGGFAKNSLLLSGGSATDSYDSGLKDPSYADQVAAAGGAAAYHLTPAGQGGNIASDGPISLSGGGTFVYGNGNPGPSYTVSASGGSAVKGSTTPLPAIVNFPTPVYSPPPAAIVSAFSFNGTMNMNAGTYRYSTWTQNGGTITMNGAVTLYIDGEFTQSGGNTTMKLAPGATLTIYQGTGKFTLSGGGVENPAQIPSSFNIVSSTAMAITLSGGSDLYGTLYAPAAPLTVSGASGFYGAVVGGAVTLSGAGGFHFDRSATSPALKGQFSLLAMWEAIP